MPVRFYTASGAFVYGVRTNKLGQYTLWLRPNGVGSSYIGRSRGQTLTPDIGTTSLTGQDFTAAVGQITATIIGPSNTLVSQAKVAVYDTSGNYQGFETSNGDGTVTTYSTVNPVRLEFKIDNGSAIASALYSSGGNVTQFSSASNVTVNVGGATNARGNVTLGAGGVLSGIVTVSGAAVGDYLVQVRSGGTQASNQFVSTPTRLDGSYSISLPAGT